MVTTSGGPPCQCDECIKNRGLVRYAAENGLLEKIFDGVRHPLSETITTTTYTQIIRAPIIEETVTTVRCEEPNCPECKKLDDEHKAKQLKELMEEQFKGMVVHQTDDSAEYRDYNNLWGLKGGPNGKEGEQGGSLPADRLKNLLSQAGNPRQEKLRGQESWSEGTELMKDHNNVPSAAQTQGGSGITA